jgi:hypothetical protein
MIARALLVFWALWFSAVSATNVADALREAEILSAGLPFVSGNFALVAESISIYSLSRAWAALLFALVILAEVSASFLFWRAALQEKPRILAPFFAGIALFCGFLICDEVLLVYRRFPNLETTHFIVFGALLLSLLLVQQLGEWRS